MENHNRIHWKKGLDISPEVFIRSDNYHIAERNLLGRFLAARTYGILPNSRFYIEKSLDYNRISISELECIAITNDGYLINIQNDTPYPKKIEIEEHDDELYLILSVDPYALPVDEQELTLSATYSFVLQRIDEHIEKGIPILKIIKEYQNWRIDEEYIPPAIALNAMDSLTQKYIDIKEVINEIIRKLPDEYPYYFQITMLHLELNSYSSQESPEELVLLMKKFSLIFQHYLTTVKNLEESTALKRFMNEPYLHHDMEKSLRTGFEALADVNLKIDEKPVEEKEEIPEFEIKV